MSFCRRILPLVFLAVLAVAHQAYGAQPSAPSGKPAKVDRAGKLKVSIHTPSEGLLLTKRETSIEVEGMASVFGGVKYLDLFLVLDTSGSLARRDPENYRTQGAVALVENLSKKSDIRIGVVDFDDRSDLVMQLTDDRAAVVEALRGFDQKGGTDLAAGIRTALEGFEQGARPDSSRVVLLFTDGISEAEPARDAAREAREQGVAVQTLLLGSRDKGEELLQEIAEATGGSSLYVTEPKELPRAFLNLRTTGVDFVKLSVNGSAPIDTELAGGSFRGSVPLKMGENRIVAAATSLDGQTEEDAVTVIVSNPVTVAVEHPADGTLFTRRETDTDVKGSASIFLEKDVSESLLASYPTLGVESVTLSVNNSPPYTTYLAKGKFVGRVPLQIGGNIIVATATSIDGKTAEARTRVTVRPPGCGALVITAKRDERPSLSISDRSVEIVFDASGSMWGQIGGTAKITIAKEILSDALDWLPRDLSLALRVYGHQSSRERKDCRDSELLVPFGEGNRGKIREAIARFQPKGQTPLAYSLRQVVDDFAGFEGERAVVLLTDGIESCDGDPAQAARELQRGDRGLPVHVIGFGLSDRENREALASLRAIADASDGQFLTAGSAEALREALTVTVGTPFEILKEEVRIGTGTLGVNEVFQLPAGEYVVRLYSTPPKQARLTLKGEEKFTLIWKRDGDAVSLGELHEELPYTPCE
jgi:Mg-chelatase subunit ChlD